MIEIEQVDLVAASEYLVQAGPSAAARWRPVLGWLAAHRDAAAAMALTTPLMVWLARSVYTDPQTDPSELTDTTRFADVATVEKHLLDAYVPSVYTAEPGAKPRSPYPPESAARWLAFLASDMTRRDVQDLAWWQLADRPRPPVVIAFLAGLIASFYIEPLATSVGYPFLLALAVTTVALRLNHVAAYRFRYQAADASVTVPAPLFARRVAQRVGWGAICGLALMAGLRVPDLLRFGAELTPADWRRTMTILVQIGLSVGVLAGLGSALSVPINTRRQQARITSRVKRAPIRERLITATLAGSAMGIFFGVDWDYPLPDGADIGAILSVGVATGIFIVFIYKPLAALLAPPPGPRRVNTRLKGRERQTLRLLLRSMALGLLIGLQVALAVYTMSIVLDYRRAEPIEFHATEMSAVLGFAGIGLVAGLLVTTALVLLDQTDSVEAVSPAVVLEQDRRTFLLTALLLATSTGSVLLLPSLYGAMTNQQLPHITAGLSGALAIAAPLAVGIASLRFVWCGFVLERWSLAVQGRLPLRLMVFLHDAYKLGVLRQTGAVYQFRHSRLQQHLSSRGQG